MTARIGIIGAGYIAGVHARNLAAMPDVELVGVADPRRERAASLAAEVGTSVYGSGEELLAESPDAVYVCVPPAFHGALELAALDRGIALFVEKPLSTDLATAEGIAAAVERAGVPVSVGYHWRYLDTVERARDLLGERPAQLVLGAWLDRAPNVDWWAQQRLSGGQLVEQATHLVDLARYLVGEIVQWQGVGGRAPGGPGDILHASTVAVSFETGAVGSFSTTCLAPRAYRAGLEIFAPGLAIDLRADEMVVADGPGEPVTHRPRRDPMEREDRAFVDALRGEGEGIRCTYAQALETHRVALALSSSALSASGLPASDGDLGAGTGG